MDAWPDDELLREVKGVRFSVRGEEESLRKPGKGYNKRLLVDSLNASVTHYLNSFKCSEASFDIPLERIIFGDHRSLTKRGIEFVRRSSKIGSDGSRKGDQSNYGIANCEALTLIPLPWLRLLRSGTRVTDSYKWPFTAGGHQFWNAIDHGFSMKEMTHYFSENPLSLQRDGLNTDSMEQYYFVSLDGNHRLLCHRQACPDDRKTCLRAHLVFPFDRENKFLDLYKETAMLIFKNSLSCNMDFLSCLVAIVEALPFCEEPGGVHIGVDGKSYDLSLLDKMVPLANCAKGTKKKITTLARLFTTLPNARLELLKLNTTVTRNIAQSVLIDVNGLNQLSDTKMCDLLRQIADNEDWSTKQSAAFVANNQPPQNPRITVQPDFSRSKHPKRQHSNPKSQQATRRQHREQQQPGNSCGVELMNIENSPIPLEKSSTHQDSGDMEVENSNFDPVSRLIRPLEKPEANNNNNSVPSQIGDCHSRNGPFLQQRSQHPALFAVPQESSEGVESMQADDQEGSREAQLMQPGLMQWKSSVQMERLRQSPSLQHDGVNKSDYDDLVRKFEALQLEKAQLSQQLAESLAREVVFIESHQLSKGAFVVLKKGEVFTEKTVIAMEKLLNALVAVEEKNGGDKPGFVGENQQDVDSLFYSIFLESDPATKDGVKFDPYRRQLGLELLERDAAVQKRFAAEHGNVIYATRAIKRELKAYLSARELEYTLSDGVILESVAGGLDQAWHRDFFRETIVHEPVTILIALSSCRLDFLDCMETKKYTTVKLDLGSVLLFRGYTIHRGCSYDALNFRMHFYCVHKSEEDKLDEITERTKIINFTKPKQLDEMALFDYFSMTKDEAKIAKKRPAAVDAAERLRRSGSAGKK